MSSRIDSIWVILFVSLYFFFFFSSSCISNRFQTSRAHTTLFFSHAFSYSSLRIPSNLFCRRENQKLSFTCLHLQKEKEGHSKQNPSKQTKNNEDEEEDDDILSLLLQDEDEDTRPSIRVAASSNNSTDTFQHQNQRLQTVSSSQTHPEESPILVTSELVTNTSNRTVTPVVTGIGGKGGIIFDVNRLKRNLVQETIRKYKRELFLLLHSSSAAVHTQQQQQQQQSMQEKINVLIQVNPVSTTTDSNLLEGRWIFMISLPVEDIILDSSVSSSSNRDDNDGSIDTTTTTTSKIQTDIPPNTLGIQDKKKKKMVTSSWTRSLQRQLLSFDKPSKISFQLTFHLENVPDEELPHVIDERIHTRGWYTSKTIYQIIGLTRKKIQLQEDYTQELWFGRKPTRTTTTRTDSTSTVPPNIIDLHILYLDTDLCISRIDDTLQIFTKNEQFTWYPQQQQQHGWKLGSRIQSIWSKRQSVPNTTLSLNTMGIIDNTVNNTTIPFHDTKSIPPSKKTKDNRMILLRDYESGSKLKVVRLGNVVRTGGKDEDEDTAWEGNEDPFVHLSADERQAKLKSMSIEEIKRARMELKKQNEKGKGWRIFTRPKAFKKPKELS